MAVGTHGDRGAVFLRSSRDYFFVEYFSLGCGDLVDVGDLAKKKPAVRHDPGDRFGEYHDRRGR